MYHFTSEWFIEGTPEQVATAMASRATPNRWWGAAFLRAEILRAGDRDGQGAIVRFLTKGWMPHTFQFVLHLMEVRYPRGFVAEVRGDFFGIMRCTLTQLSSGMTAVKSEWKVRVEKPYVKRLSPWLRRVFVLNHRWVMRCGERGLQQEVRRGSRQEAVHTPHGLRQPTFPHNLAWWVNRIPWRPWTASWDRALWRA